MNKFIAIVGMTGSGKSLASEYLKKKGFACVRFGQVVLDELKKNRMEINEKNEREVRERLRKEHGMAAMAVLNLSKFQKALEKKHLVGDGLYSWEEDEFLQEKFPEQLIILAIYASRKTRYHRLSSRKLSKKDTKAIYRKLTPKEARSRDVASITNLHKGGPIAIADWTIINEGTIEELHRKIDKFLENFEINA